MSKTIKDQKDEDQKDYMFDKYVNFKVSYLEVVPFLETQSPKSFDSMMAKYACAVLANLTYRCQSPPNV